MWPAVPHLRLTKFHLGPLMCKFSVEQFTSICVLCLNPKLPNPEQTGKEALVPIHQALGHEEVNITWPPCIQQRNECIVGHITHNNYLDQEDKGAGDGWGRSHGWAYFSIVGQHNSPSLCFNVLLLWPYVSFMKKSTKCPWLSVKYQLNLVWETNHPSCLWKRWSRCSPWVAWCLWVHLSNVS